MEYNCGFLGTDSGTYTTVNSAHDSMLYERERLRGAAPLGSQIVAQCDALAIMLLKKNISYGNSATEPVKAFSKATAKERLASRIDDKITRLINGTEYPDDDTVLDLIGYLILYRIEDEDNSQST